MVLKSIQSLCFAAISLAAAIGFSAEQPATSSPPRHKVVFVGMDGATWRVIGPLLEQGELPSFAKLVANGTSMPNFDTMSTTESPLVWTSMATGVEPSVHGITDYVDILEDGSRVPVTSNSRKVKAIWDLVGEHGMSVGVINWWASWPAEEVNGYVISNHAHPLWVQGELADSYYWTDDEADAEGSRGNVFPPELTKRAKRYWIAKEDLSYEEMQQHGGFSDEQIAAARGTRWFIRWDWSVLKLDYAVDVSNLRLWLDLTKSQPADLEMLYFHSPDAIQHYCWDLVEPEKYHYTPKYFERDRTIVDNTYRYLDSFLKEILGAIDDNTILILASDHGSEAAPWATAEKPRRTDRPGYHSLAAKGVLFLLGPGVKKGHTLSDADPLDIMPTLAWLLGIPVSKELPGRPLTEAFTDEFVAARPIKTVPSYGARETRAPETSAADDAMIERLRALGYIE